MNKRINQIKERIEKATPGRWKVEKIYHEEPYENYIKSAAIICNGYMVTRNDWSNPVMADLEFIAHAREDIPYLLNKINELQEQNEVLADTVNMLSPLMMENYKLKNNHIVESLEKQLPKTPMQNFYNEGDYNWECVNCEETVDEGQNYCHNCGQKLVEWEG